MASQRQRQSRLASLLRDLGRPEAPARPPAPRLDTMPAEAVDRVLALYRALGGDAEDFVDFRPGVWDIVLADGVIVELDEEQHFNRYRRVTLEPDWTDGLPWASDFRRYCDEHELSSLRKAKRGGYWSSPSTERMFGPAAPPGEFGGHGSPRWKQRALYDAMRDALAAAGEVRLARVAVWDSVGDATLARVLDGRVEADHDSLAELVERRTAGAAAGE
jgi:hypothetical protein